MRPWEAADAALLVQAWRDPDIIRFNGVPPETTLDFAERWIASTAGQGWDSPSLDLVADQDGDVMGELGLQVDRDRGIAEIGFWTVSSARRSGVGDGLVAAAELLAEPLGVSDLYAVTHAANHAATGLLQRRSWEEVETVSETARGFRFRPFPTRR